MKPADGREVETDWRESEAEMEDMGGGRTDPENKQGKRILVHLAVFIYPY